MIGFLVVDLLQITRQISFWRIWSANQTQEDKPNAVFALPCLLSRFVLVTVPISLSHHYLQKVYSSQSHTQKTHFHSIIESLISFFFFTSKIQKVVLQLLYYPLHLPSFCLFFLSNPTQVRGQRSKLSCQVKLSPWFMIGCTLFYF